MDPQGSRAFLVDECIYKLSAWTKTADADLLQLIGKCLGQFGPILKSARSFPTPMEKVVANVQLTNKDSVDIFFQRYTIEMCTAIIEKLRSYLQDENVQVVEEAMKLLKSIFDHSDEVYDALKERRQETCDRNQEQKRVGNKRGPIRTAREVRHSDDLVSFLQPFATKGSDNCSTASASSLLRRNQTAHPTNFNMDSRLWSTNDAGCGKKYDEWLQTLAHSLCVLDRSNEIWPRCAPMCKLKTDFAELIFPSLLFSLFLSSLEDDSDDDVAEYVGRILTECIFSEDNSNLKAIRLVLQGLDGLRLVKQTIIQHKIDLAKCNKAIQIQKWSYSYFFHIPYINVARAARRCSAHLTSLLYMELHHDWNQVPAQQKSNEELLLAQQKSNEELLLAYRAVEEPDGLDAFNKLPILRSSFIDWEHHGEHAKVSYCRSCPIDFDMFLNGLMMFDVVCCGRK